MRDLPTSTDTGALFSVGPETTSAREPVLPVAAVVEAAPVAALAVSEVAAAAPALTRARTGPLVIEFAGDGLQGLKPQGASPEAKGGEAARDGT